KRGPRQGRRSTHACRRVRTRAGWLAVLALVAAAALVIANRSDADSTCTGNAIVCENQQPGTDPSVWDVNGAGDSSIQGFATDISANKGDTVNFKVNAPNVSSYKIDIYRLGYYQGNGARFVAEIGPFTGTSQPTCLTDSTGLVDCGNWSVSASWQVPTDAVSGVYVARLVRLDTLAASHMVFVVRDDA